ncbi:MAG: S9 family peptidase [Bacteroidales bacterium]|nr:S9 family peptidase [Bacteroidales bacterium]
MRKGFIMILVFVLAFGQQAFSQNEKKQITLDDIWTNNAFSPKMVYGIFSLNNGTQYTRIKDGSIVVYDYRTGDSVKTLVNGADLIPEGETKPIKITSFEVNKDENEFIFPTEVQHIYRHSRLSYDYVWNSKTKKLTPLSTKGKQRLAQFSPDGSKIAFVRDNNIYLKDLNTGEEKQITFDGKTNSIINGTCDWVYEEEFSFTKAFFWSPDNSKIAFYRFDESQVKQYTLPFYGSLYPREYTYKYPVPGEKNSIVQIMVYDLKTGKTTTMDVGNNIDQYIPRIKWTTNPNVLAIERLNRHQNHLQILLADATTGQSHILYDETNKYYIDITDDLTFLPDGKQFLMTSEKDGYNAIYLYDMDGKLVRKLTNGDWDVMQVYGYNPKHKEVFFQAAKSSPLDRDIYAVTLKGKLIKISEKEGTNEALFSKSFDYYINTWSNANIPPYITVNNRKGKVIRVLESNEKLIKTMSDYAMSPQTFFQLNSSEFTLPDGKQIPLNAFMIKPPDFNPNKKYPVLMYVYGGPGINTVNNEWGGAFYLWYEMLAEKGIIVISVDNRGTGARGEIFKKMTYLQLGHYEIADQMEAAKLIGKLPYVDSTRIGIFGWSYGGFMASLGITKGADIFSTAVAVAPVTSWRYYDDIYTERYMRTPKENPEGYKVNSPLYYVKDMKGDGNFLLIFGSADDNVHPQNSMQFITDMIKNNKQFHLMIYPNKNHSIYGGNTRYHLFTRMTDFLMKQLKP